MKTIKLTTEAFDEAARETVKVLRAGGTVVMPTDTVYGLMANACDDRAVEQIFKIKKRDNGKPMPILVRNIAWAREVAFIPPKLEPYLDKIWPGAVTIILPRKQTISKLVTGGPDTIGVRVAKSDLVDRVLAQFGYPIVATSANIAGEGGSNDPEVIRAQFRAEIWTPDIIIDAARMPDETPSTVIDFTAIKPKVLRIGAVRPEQLLALLELET